VCEGKSGVVHVFSLVLLLAPWQCSRCKWSANTIVAFKKEVSLAQVRNASWGWGKWVGWWVGGLAGRQWNKY